MDRFGASGTPFLFIIDFAMVNPIVLPLSQVDPAQILYDIDGFSNSDNVYTRNDHVAPFVLKKYPINYVKYKKAFDLVHRQFVLGNTFLLNLTFPTPIEISLDAQEIYSYSRARYRLYVNGRFLVFSPECFVKIRSNRISSYPMKGTIDASIPNAKQEILSDPKEMAEHVTIVDLIRNDIGMVAGSVRVSRFRYIDVLETSENTLLQVSSEVTGLLSDGYEQHIGTLISRMLPAGSISGAPKKKTVEIILTAEGYDRGYYTGVFGYFDGKNLDSGVMIRFIDLHRGKLFKSGGGLTVYSDPEKEYQELKDKVYVPIVRDHQNR